MHWLPPLMCTPERLPQVGPFLLTLGSQVDSAPVGSLVWPPGISPFGHLQYVLEHSYFQVGPPVLTHILMYCLHKDGGWVLESLRQTYPSKSVVLWNLFPSLTIQRQIEVCFWVTAAGWEVIYWQKLAIDVSGGWTKVMLTADSCSLCFESKTV